MKRHWSIRALWLVGGLLALVLAAAGAILPLLPTTPFVLVAVYAFARSSRRLTRWLLRHRYFGPLIENWRRYGAIDRRVKIVSVSVMAALPFLTWLIGAPYWALGAQIVVLIAAASFVLSRPDCPARNTDLHRHKPKKTPP